MTPPAPVPEATLPARPGSVLGAVLCFWLAGLLLVAQVPQVVYDLVTLPGVTRRAGAMTSASAAEIRNEIGAARVFDVVVLLVVLVLTSALVVSALWFARGRDTGRVTAIVVACVVMLCCGVALVGSVVGSQQADASEFQRQVTALQEAGTPAWTGWLTLAALAVYPLLLAGTVLLLVGPSRRYFRPFAGYYVYPLPPQR